MAPARRAVCSFSLILFLYAGLFAFGQTVVYAPSDTRTKAPEPRFALAIETFPSRIDRPGTPPIYMMVPEGTRGTTFQSPCSDSVGFARGKEPRASYCKLAAKVEGDAVVMTLTIYFGDFDKNDVLASLPHVPHQDFGPYTARLSQKVVLRPMGRFGLEQWRIKVETPKTKPRPHQLITEVASAKLEYVDENRAWWRVRVHNLSDKRIISIYLKCDKAGGASGFGKPRIAPGTLSPAVGCPNSARQIPAAGGYVDSREPPTITLRAVLYEDNSYEGNEDYAPTLMASVLATRYQRTRILQLVSDIVADETMEDAARAARIRAEVPKISEEIDPEMMAQLRARFPKLSGKARQLAERHARGLMGFHKWQVVVDLSRFEQRQEAMRRINRPTRGLADWLRTWRDSEPDSPYNPTGLVQPAP